MIVIPENIRVLSVYKIRVVMIVIPLVSVNSVLYFISVARI